LQQIINRAPEGNSQRVGNINPVDDFTNLSRKGLGRAGRLRFFVLRVRNLFAHNFSFSHDDCGDGHYTGGDKSYKRDRIADIPVRQRGDSMLSLSLSKLFALRAQSNRGVRHPALPKNYYSCLL